MKETLLNELKDAMKNKDEIKKNTITMLRAAILQVEKDTKKNLEDSDIQAIVAKEVKKRRESVAEFEKASRQDLVESVKKEIEILSKYLPEQLSKGEVIKIVKEAITLVGATSQKDMGKVMQEVRSKTSGKADGKLVSDIVKDELSNI